MNNHEVEVAQISKRTTPSGEEARSTIGSIIVKPPLTIGEFFDTAIRGRDGHGVNFSHVLTTSEVTVFVAGSSLETPEKREAAIYTVAERMKRLVNTPEKVIELIDENPFPAPPKK
jgi:hypothetical protein